jgi:molybdenum cofactor cytidylyltransferase
LLELAAMTARRGALILAAGASKRMGTPKALLPWGKTTLLDSAISTARRVPIEEIVVVLGPSTQELQKNLAVSVAFNPQPETGRSASIRLGSALLSEDVSAILIQSVDQPSSKEIISALFEAIFRGGMVAVPTYEGRRGHPICLNGRLLTELREVTEQDEGLRSIVRRHRQELVEVPVGSESVVWNLNDPAAYEAARTAAGQ